MTNKRILFVDDDPNILNGYKRALRKEFDIFTAESGNEALSLLKTEPEFAVIISDMRMPMMDGIQFLKFAKEISPNSVRMMLTGNADQKTAIDAVNEGRIFRFMTKPCEPEFFAKAIYAGIEQYDLITAEKVLLSQTLNNSLQVMIEILSMVNPMAFSRANRIKRLARDIAKKIGIKRVWEIEIAAMLSQIGCITVPEEILQKVNKGEELDANELQLFHQHPQVGYDLISRIPRMKTVAEIISNQNLRFDRFTQGTTQSSQVETSVWGAWILKAVLDFDKLIEMGTLPHQAIRELETRTHWYNAIVLETLKYFINQASEEFVSVEIDVNELKPGMLIDSPVFTNKRILLLSKEQEVTLPLILKLISFAEQRVIPRKIQVSVPVSQFQVEETDGFLPPMETNANNNYLGAI